MIAPRPLHDAAAVRHGYYTYVIPDSDVRPSNAKTVWCVGVTWLPWGGVFPNGVLIYRNMLASPEPL